MSKISILIPSYKPGSYISRCLQSIENQTLSKDHFMVYVALNGPKENFENYLKEELNRFSFSYKLFFLPEPGVSNARNFLIENSIEPYVCFVDDDDILSDNYLEELLKVSAPSVMGIANVYNFKINLDFLHENYIGRSFKALPEYTASKFKLRKYFSSPCSKLIHRSIIDGSRFDTNLVIGEDSLFMAKISHRVEAAKKTDPKACYYVYERQGSTTRRKIDRKRELKRILHLLREYSKMLFSLQYNMLFVLSRLAATVKHLRRII